MNHTLPSGPAVGAPGLGDAVSPGVNYVTVIAPAGADAIASTPTEIRLDTMTRQPPAPLIPDRLPELISRPASRSPRASGTQTQA